MSLATDIFYVLAIFRELSSRWASLVEYLELEDFCRTRRFIHELSKLVLQLVFRWGVPEAYDILVHILINTIPQ